MRLTFRNHRKLVVIDGSHAFIGGCNVGDEYDGDGVEQGWRDLGLRIQAPLCVAALARSFERMWDMAPFNHLPGSATMPEGARDTDWELFFAGAGRGGRRYRRQLHRDLGQARQIDVLAAYFVPTTRVRALLGRAAHRGKVRLVVPAASDVTIAHYASRMCWISSLPPLVCTSMFPRCCTPSWSSPTRWSMSDPRTSIREACASTST